VKTVDAEQGGRSTQQMANEVTQRGNIADTMPLDQVAKDHYIHLLLQPQPPVVVFPPLHFREAPVQ